MGFGIGLFSVGGLIGVGVIMHCLVIDSGVYPVGHEFKHS